MYEQVSNILRGVISSFLYVVLLFTLTKSRLSRKGIILLAIFVFILNVATNIWFYLYGDLTTLSRFSVLLFILIGLGLKPLTRLNFMEWSFTFLTSTNIGIMIIIVSFHLGKLFPYPQYSITVVRAILYLIIITIVRRFLLPSFHSVVKNWPIFSALMVAVFLNLSYYFYITDDIKQTLITYRTPMLLLVIFSLTAYGTIFYALKKFSAMYAIEMENERIQKESGRLQEIAVQLEHYANQDMLTNLPNRRSFFERVEALIVASEHTGEIFTLLYIDLDGFKNINDTHGHEIGDEILKAVGNRLIQCVRESDFTARIGGDEFAVIVHNLVDHTSVEHLVERIHSSLEETINVDDIQCNIKASIGIARYPESGKDSGALMRHADTAMYGVKRSRKRP